MKKKVLIIVLVIFIFGYLLRVLFLKDFALTFGYDQARDATVSQQIVKGDLKILGPPASIPGLYHGVFYYYLLAPAYLLGQGNPTTAAYWIAFINALTTFIVFYLTYLLTRKSFLAAALASALFAVSFEATQYATWLSNPTIGIWTVPLIYLGLWAWVKEGKKWAPIVCAIGFGLSIQSEVFLLYHIIPILLWLWLGRKQVTKKSVAVFGIFLALSLSTIIVSEVKFGFKSFSGLLQLSTQSEGNFPYVKSLGDYLVLYLNQTGRVFAFNSYPGNVGYGGAFVLILGLLGLRSLGKKEKLRPESFLSTWLFSHLSVVTVGGTSTPFLMVGIGPAVSILIAVYLYKWWENGYRFLTAFVVIALLFGNLSFVFKENPKGSTLFAIQKDMILAKQLRAIDYTYKEADGKPFTINSLTSPLWINIVWTYLYKWYGLPKYGYLPEWHGRDQVGQLDSLPPTSSETSDYFLILEPMGGIPTRYLEETISEENAVSTFVEEKQFGELRVQKRVKL